MQDPDRVRSFGGYNKSRQPRSDLDNHLDHGLTELRRTGPLFRLAEKYVWHSALNDSVRIILPKRAHVLDLRLRPLF